MRFIVCLPISLVLGLCAGFCYPSRAPAPVVIGVEIGRLSEPAAPLDSPKSAHAKQLRLISAALRKGGGFERENALYLAIESFNAEDFNRLLNEPGALKAMADQLRNMDGELRRGLGLAMVTRWLAVDANPVKTWAARVLALLPPKDSLRNSLRAAFSAKRPEEMLSLLSKDDRSEIISEAMYALAMRNPAKADAWFNGFTDPLEREWAEQAMHKGLARVDPVRGVELAGRTGSTQTLFEAVKWAAKKGPGTLRQLATSPLAPGLLSPMLNYLTRIDPEMALEFATKAGIAGEARNNALGSVFSEIAGRAPAEAILKMEGLTGQELAAAVSAIGRKWAWSEPAAALTWLSTRPAAERGNDVLLSEFHSWAMLEKGEARIWADALPLGATRDAVQVQMARALAERGEAAEAAQLLARLNGGTEPKVIAEIAGAWARQDPQSAADWAIALPSEPPQSSALARIVGTWASDSPHGVESWLEQFPPGDARDRSVSAFLKRENAWALGGGERIAEFDAWFDLIEDPWRRAQAAKSIFWYRSQRDQIEARAWLAALPNVDPEVIRMMLRKRTY